MKNCAVKMQGEKVIPVGYNLTEMGIIPSDWKIEQLGNLCTLKSGLSITSKDIDDSSFYRCFGGNGLRGYTKKYTHDGNFALIGRQGALCGNIQYVSGQFFASEHALVASPTKGVDPKWLSIYLETMNLNQYSESSAQPGLSAEKLRILKLITPNLNEQTAIANVLSDTDALITELEKLIAKKQAIKTATMQQLLTGRTRLPQFAKHPDGVLKGNKPSELGLIPEDWICVTLGEIGQCIIGLTYSPRDVSDTGTLVLRSSNVQNNKLAYQDNVFVNMDLPERVIVRKGDILICVRNGSRKLIGKCALIDHTAEGCAFGAFMAIYRTKAHDFIFYQFQSNLIHNQIDETMGATINQITNKDLSGFIISMPSCDQEQTAIATILLDMDAELEALEQKLAKVRDIKQGMMQQLLTGRIRLPLDRQP
ncbi:TPA: restriction endonuclease subunit S [Klebsiella pneumoniae subsp. pneumoniae]|uniref:restriction endonuclease subunit S n=1 Tax=Enterobacteriaceae TaxID=543 RepID=UPI0024AF4C82|nr:MULTISPECIES: restriction endonuclease subunit S [Enterobacteriaceae]MDU1998698.1 restriction endonuclease subunit S [Enterobacter hormaechei]HBQ5823557.1 restriction endonuclease subunit S [Klebsiella pneumoniae subsp. pneumoniae]HDW0969522.1 restriction endonuclease subunit S [Enterobacter hormaechei subsp. xiangfangensis]MDI7493885.1 restriction endonuclease subunit S [Cronobacter dublinensis]MDU2011689.1 restriction endonuclease subunit S [Enterobacter hormaechei]